MKYRNESEFKQLIKKNKYDAGYDICSNENICVPCKTRKLISTGLYLQIPQGFVGVIKSRSGLSVNEGIEVGAGVIDSTYRGEVKVLLYNHSFNSFPINKGDRIAQLLIIPLYDGEIKEVEELTETDRGGNGFGSTGI